MLLILQIIFVDFMKSNFSPLQIIESKYDTVNQFDQIINSIIKAIQAFSEINYPSSNEIIGLFVSRFWFSRTLICKFEMMKENKILQTKLLDMNTKKIKNLNPPKSCLNIFNFDVSIIEFCESNSFLSQSIDLFDSCMFLYAPEDIMKEFHLIFAGCVATKMKTNIDDEIVLDGVQFLWKLLFIISSIPNINGVISFVQKYMSYDCYPKILFETFQIPLNVFKSLQK